MAELKTYSSQITDYIKELLLNGQLVPGDKVNEVQIASTLSISRAPVREALQILVSEGLIESIPQRGKFIKALTAKEIKDSYFVGGVLEGAAVAATVNLLSDEDFAVLKDIIEQMKILSIKAENPKQFAELDIAFHKKLLEKNTNDILIEQSRTVCQRMSKFLLFRHWHKQYTSHEVYLRHKEILDAVLSKNPACIEKIIREHYISLSLRMAAFGSDNK